MILEIIMITLLIIYVTSGIFGLLIDSYRLLQIAGICFILLIILLMVIITVVL